MRHFVIGTSGHIDHGKTTLVRALTGIDCDRLKEEKERGITIDLGFAFFDLPSGRRAGIVDVPGHERFIKNMLAGAGGIDVVLWVVAADEGVMPQSNEHLAILSILQIKRGIIVVTKADLVDPEWLELVLLDIRERVQGTFLAEAPLVSVSAVTGVGLPELVAEIDAMCEQALPKDASQPMRMPIDRVFTVQGFGTVVTGTLQSGAVKVGDTVEILPAQFAARVRGVGVHGQKVGQAVAGQRTAINLAGVQVSQLARGDVLAAPQSIKPSLMLDVRLTLLNEADKVLSNRERLRLYTGAAEVLCRAVLLEQDALAPGESAYAQLRLEEPLAVVAGDRFVLRSYSPMSTIGGGSVIDPGPQKRKRFREKSIAELETLESGSTGDVLLQILAKAEGQLLPREELLRLVHRPDKEAGLEELLAQEAMYSLRADEHEYIISSLSLLYLQKKIDAELALYHRRYPLRSGLPREELRGKVLPSSNNRLFASLLLFLQDEAGYVLSPRTIASRDFAVEFVGKWARGREQTLTVLHNDLFSPPPVEDMAAQSSFSTEEQRELMEALAERGEVVKVAEGAYFHSQALLRTRELLVAHFQSEEELTLATFRTMIDSSRKYALLLLEYCDQKRLTTRQGENRRRAASFDSVFFPC